MNKLFYQAPFITKINLLLVVLTALLLTTASCTKEEPKHHDVVTATINGKPWKAGCKESPPFGCSASDLQYYTNTGGFELTASNSELDTGIAVRLKEVYSTGVYFMSDRISCATLDKGSSCGLRRHYINEGDPQQIEIIKINNQDKIIEGRFHFIGHDTNCLIEPIRITNGYFKVRYRP